MKITPESKSCSLKGSQQVFYLQFNQVASCCRAYADQLDANKPISYYQKQWQQESQLLKDGVELDGCQHCWQVEHQGKMSYRQQAPLISENLIQLYISNLCNHMCSYCSPKYSSVWEESIHTHGAFKNISSTAKLNLESSQPSADINHWIDQIQSYINTCDENSVVLKLLGGEPLMQQRNLEKLLSVNSTKIKTLMIHTNLSPPTDKFLRWLLDSLSVDKLKISISLDTHPDYNHIPRAGFDRQKFLSNLELLQNKNVTIDFNSVVSVLSIFDLENFINWKNSNNFKVGFTKLHNPDCLDPQYVPFEFREKIWNKVSHLSLDPIIAEILQHPDNAVDLKLLEQYNYLTEYFNRNAIDPEQVNNTTFVEYWTWLTNKFKR